MQGRHDLREERAIRLVTDGTVYSIAPQAMTLGGDNDTPAKAARREARHGHFRLEAMPVMPCVITRHCENSRGVDAARYSESPQESRWDKSTLFRTSGAEINTTRMKRNNNRQKFLWRWNYCTQAANPPVCTILPPSHRGDLKCLKSQENTMMRLITT